MKAVVLKAISIYYNDYNVFVTEVNYFSIKVKTIKN